MRVLVLLAHPALERSRVNLGLMRAARDCPGVTLHDLYEEYPDLHIDVGREQELLLGHDVIVFQHPFFWYSVPSILKEWQDLVLEHNWAYGSEGRRLHGKITFNALTAGGPAQAYRQGGYNRFTVRQLLAPWEATAHLCGMRYLAPFVVHGSLRLAAADVDPHAAAYRRLLEALVDERVDLDLAARVECLDDTPGIIRPAAAAGGAAAAGAAAATSPETAPAPPGPPTPSTGSA
jgi:glutathione-regulated potassium-efflux system ancillary protein KefG